EDQQTEPLLQTFELREHEIIAPPELETIGRVLRAGEARRRRRERSLRSVAEDLAERDEAVAVSISGTDQRRDEVVREERSPDLIRFLRVLAGCTGGQDRKAHRVERDLLCH